MPKVVESKLIFKSEDRGMKANVDSITAAIERLGSAVEKTAKQFEAMATAMGGMVGGKTFAMKGGAGRSPNAPPKEPKEPKDKGLYPGWHSGMRFAGAMMGAAGGIVGGLGHQVTPAIGGMLAAAGGAVSSVTIAGVPVGALPGAGLMALGGLMTAASLVSQPAMQHYGQFADTYRLLGHDESMQLRSRMRGFTPDEAMRYGQQLHKFGGMEAAGVMGKLRYGPASPEMLAKFFETATTTGAAGKRTRADYDYLAKVIYSGFDKNKNMVSMEQSLETLQSLMGISADYLGDISKGQEKALTGLTARMEASGVAVLRGPRGVQTMGGIVAKYGAEGTPGEEMSKWEEYRAYAQSHNEPASLEGYYNWRANPTTVAEAVRGLDVSTEMGRIYAMRRLGVKTPELAAKIVTGLQRPQGDEAYKEAIRNLESGKEVPGFKPKGDEGVYTAKHAEQLTKQLEASTKYMEKYMKMETDLIEMVARALEGAKFDAAVTKFADAVREINIATGGGTPEEQLQAKKDIGGAITRAGAYINPTTAFSQWFFDDFMKRIREVAKQVEKRG